MEANRPRKGVLIVAFDTVISLASGGGGLDMGIRRVLPATRTVCYVENEVTAAAVLVENIRAGHLHEAPVWTDLKSFDARPWRGLVDGLTGGYPCQPFSVAGKQRGAEDPRHLWPYIAGIVADLEVPWCFFENVGGHLRLGFREVAQDLRAMGYRVAATLYRAEEVGAPHQRERLFILAHSNQFDGDRGGDFGTRWRAESANCGSAVGDTDIEGLEGRGGTQPRSADQLPAWPPSPADDEGWRRIPERFWPATTEPVVRGLVNGLARTDLLRVYGNGVVPAQAAAAFTELREALNEQS